MYRDWVFETAIENNKNVLLYSQIIHFIWFLEYYEECPTKVILNNVYIKQ